MQTKVKKTKDKKCKSCGNKYTPSQFAQQVCSPRCAIDYTNKNKAEKAKTARRQEIAYFRDNDRALQLKLAQSAFNKFIRLRDKDDPCISCGTTANVQYAAGHYRTRGATPALRFHEDNCHKQCNRYCNSGLSGNIREYRLGLLKKIGQERLDFIEGPHELKRYTIEEIIAIKKKYAKKCKEMLDNDK